MARRCPRSKALGLARLERHRLAVMREGWLTAVRDPSSAVHGVLGTWPCPTSRRSTATRACRRVSTSS